MARFCRWLSGFVASLLAISCLATMWHLCGWAYAIDTTYPVTSYFANCVGIGFCGACLAASCLLGRLVGNAGPVAVGMVAPLPVGLIYEVAQDPTNHNLFPFEIVLMWMPTFLLTFAAAALGARLWTPLRPVPRADGHVHAPAEGV